jgi:hypothetical protein
VCLGGLRNTKRNLTVAGCSGPDSNPPPPDCITAWASCLVVSLTLQHTVVTICTTCAVCENCISWAHQWAAIILLRVFSPLLFVLETACVYCSVRLESLNINQVNILISGFPCQYHSTKAPYSSSSTCCRYQKDKRAKPGNLKNNQRFFGNRGASDVLAMSQAVSHGCRIAEAWIRSRSGLC